MVLDVCRFAEPLTCLRQTSMGTSRDPYTKGETKESRGIKLEQSLDKAPYHVNNFKWRRVHTLICITSN